MRKLGLVVLVIIQVVFIFYQKSATAQGPCHENGGYSHRLIETLRDQYGRCYYLQTFYCCDGTIDQETSTFTWGCVEDCCSCKPGMCGIHPNACPQRSLCNSIVSSEATETGCHYVVKSYDCDGDFVDQTEADSGPPPDGLSCCDAAPGDDAFCPEDQRVEYPVGSGNYYCQCGTVTWYESEPWRQGLPGPPPPSIP